MNFEHVTRGGPYFRVVDPAWVDPSDTSYSKRNGGRWNKADHPNHAGFGALYLNASIAIARANARRHISACFGPTITIDDLADTARPQLQHYDIRESDFVDALTPAGVAALGLPRTYPTDIPHPPCQAIATAAYAANEDGIAVRSAVGSAPTDEELVIFDRAVIARAVKTKRDSFVDWF